MSAEDWVLTAINCVQKSEIVRGNPWINSEVRDWISIVYVVDGELEYSSGGIVYRVKPGEVFFAAPGDREISASVGESVTYIFSDFYAMEPIIFADGLISRINRFISPGIPKMLFDRLLSLWNRGDIGNQMRCRAQLYTILNTIIAEKNHYELQNKKYVMLKPAVEQMTANLSAPVSRKELAALCSLSESTFTRSFVSYYGCTPMEYLRNLRIEKAKTELEQSDLPIQMIAERCGYADIYSFSRTFKRITGLTPSSWRACVL